MEHELRRFVPRQFANWPGIYVVEGDLGKRCGDCRIIDVSTAGAGLELLDAPEEAAEGRLVFVAVHLQGVVKYSRPGDDGHQKVGIQFVHLSDQERAYLASLTTLDARW